MGAIIKLMKGGPAIVENDPDSNVVSLVHEDNTVEIIENRFALCMCGLSGKMPFCDGSHRRNS